MKALEDLQKKRSKCLRKPETNDPLKKSEHWLGKLYPLMSTNGLRICMTEEYEKEGYGFHSFYFTKDMGSCCALNQHYSKTCRQACVSSTDFLYDRAGVGMLSVFLQSKHKSGTPPARQLT
ncbi:hypothetical protein AVEN_127024-1 [Araneus ventricosus]|uniref:Uncharacterized protein n=1 Tax=Araneus ventricosus TaxID=182803 RepID=A0A4Y2C0C0_ARAVE|nr:hypothetical protein AVEN_127024-1 [Araneus ventricosus]